MRLLLVEDDEIQAQAIHQALTQQGYVVDLAVDGETGWDFVQAFTYDLILLDISLPKLDGISLCRRIRQQNLTVPILLLTARDDSQDKVQGLDAGADDYVVKPCTPPELFARLRALLRRRSVAGALLLEWGDLCLDPSSHNVTYQEEFLSLSPKEYGLLELFLRNPKRVLTHSTILEHLWSFDDPPTEATIRAHMKRLRRKLKNVGIDEIIQTIYGVGYRLLPAPESPSDSGQSSYSLSTLPEEKSPATALTQLWEKSKGQIQERLDILERVLKAATQGKMAEEDRAQGQITAHKLAGSLGIFGKQMAYQLAQEMEDYLMMLKAPELDRTQREDRVNGLKILLQQLQEELGFKPAEIVNSSSPLLRVPEQKIWRILVVDDDAELVQQLQQEAVHWQIRLEGALSIEEARHLIIEKLPDLVLLDLVFPEHPDEGLMFLQELRLRFPDLPILAFSVRDGLSDRVAVAESGTAFLSKASSPAEVYESILGILQASHSVAPRVLVVDDDPVFLASLEPLLWGWGLQFTPLLDSRRFWEVLESTAPDLLILDLEMPHFDGLQLCQVVRQDRRWQGLPILFVTVRQDPSVIQRIYQSGADDYLAKPFTEGELATRIFNRLERCQLLNSLSDTDLLTGLTNRRCATQDLKRYLRLSQRHNQSLCLILLDVDRLEQINQSYGYKMGDRILQQLGSVLQQHFRLEDIIARWEGDEFLIGIYAMSKEDGLKRVTHLLSRLETERFMGTGKTEIKIKVSAGLAVHPDDGEDVGSLYAIAQNALNQAQNQGGGIVLAL
ncbi:response regulator [Spirulina subsalsa FACHB-351]|uniref:Response regulator n=1 Tax=Spirulina subsalsa FACHB-351 TaxID=234711 RepID=A0ABT3L0E4_9CYAN|nr:response regulator [Spirulina subsalsa]MCW6034972.1 response regulator [Spirulina subsalsa FACHB-351]